MLQVRGTSILNTKAIQVPMCAESLNSNDVFVVFLKTAVYIWCGKVNMGYSYRTCLHVRALANQDRVFVMKLNKQIILYK